MKILVACEKSKRVAKAFRNKGHIAYSCDILPPEDGNYEWFIQDNVRNHLCDGWDMMIAHPDCTTLANSGVRWLFERDDRFEQMVKDCEFFNLLLNAPISKIAIENPIQHRYARQYIRPPDQIIQPYYFGDHERKATCLWLIGLPPLLSKFTGGDDIKQSVFYEPPSPERKANRARTFYGIAQAMAEQWG